MEVTDNFGQKKHTELQMFLGIYIQRSQKEDKRNWRGLFYKQNPIIV
jgi:hypothetical protein